MKQIRGVFVDEKGRVYGKHGTLLAQYRRPDGYLTVKIGTKTKLVHRLVAAAYLGNVDGLQVDHMDGDRSNNSVDNLQIVSRAENLRRRNTRHGWASYGKIQIKADNPSLADWAKRINEFYSAPCGPGCAGAGRGTA